MTTHCLPQRTKLTFSAIFSSGVFSKGTVNEEKIAKNVNIVFGGNHATTQMVSKS